MQIPVRVAGCALLWILGAVLLIWDTTHNQAVVGKWGLYCAAAAAAWTVIIGMHRANRASLEHFERRMKRVLQEEQIADLDAARY